MSVESNPSQPAPDSKQSTLGERVRSLRLSAEQDSKGGSSRLRFLPWAFVCVLLLTTMAFGYRAYRVDRSMRDLEEGKEGARENGKKLKAPGGYSGSESDDGASVGEVVLQAKGYVIPLSLIQVSPKVGGQLIKIADGFKEGAHFKKGDVLAWLESDDYQAEFEQAQASYFAARERYDETETSIPLEVKKAEADLKEMQETLDTQTQPKYERAKRLYGNNTITREEMEQAKSNYDSMRARIRSLEASLDVMRKAREGRRQRASKFEMQQAQAMMNKAKLRLSWTEIRAPIDGVILSKKAEEGNVVNPSAFSSGISASLCEMADLTKLEVDLSIQERDIAQIKEGMPCLIMPEAYQSYGPFLKAHPRGYEGFVSRLMPMADRAKGAVPVRVQIMGIDRDEAGKYLRPEMSALVSFVKK